MNKIQEQGYANIYKKNMNKKGNKNIDNGYSNKINVNNNINKGINFENINDWGNIVYHNEQNINECINKLENEEFTEFEIILSI